MTALRWTRHAPGHYTTRLPDDSIVRVYRDCECGRCSPWVVVHTDADGYEEGRWAGHHTMGAARYWVTLALLQDRH
jgi:hypothetical protein